MLKFHSVVLVLLFSNIYFDANDSAREKIQGVFMTKVDCIAEMRQKQFEAGHDEGFGEGLLEVARNLLINGVSLDFISKNTNLPISKIIELKNEIESSK